MQLAVVGIGRSFGYCWENHHLEERSGLHTLLGCPTIELGNNRVDKRAEVISYAHTSAKWWPPVEWVRKVDIQPRISLCLLGVTIFDFFAIFSLVLLKVFVAQGSHSAQSMGPYGGVRIHQQVKQVREKAHLSARKAVGGGGGHVPWLISSSEELPAKSSPAQASAGRFPGSEGCELEAYGCREGPRNGAESACERGEVQWKLGTLDAAAMCTQPHSGVSSHMHSQSTWTAQGSSDSEFCLTSTTMEIKSVKGRLKGCRPCRFKSAEGMGCTLQASTTMWTIKRHGIVRGKSNSHMHV
eukprot:scaffold17701_cov31-Tisochrysis_lutea.AAC.2